MKIELGKTYRDGLGRDVKIIGADGPRHFPYLGKIMDGPTAGQGNTYSDTGKWWHFEDQPHERDLVKEVRVAEIVPVTSNHEIEHADLIRAVLDGKVVQSRNGAAQWSDHPALGAIAWLLQSPDGYEFRLKPEPEVRWLSVFKLEGGNIPISTLLWIDKTYANKEQGGRLYRLEIDPDSLALTVTEDAP